MSSKASSSLKELKGLREAVLAEEKARTQALLQNLPDPDSLMPPSEPSPARLMDSFDSEGDDSEIDMGAPPANSTTIQPVVAKPPPPRPTSALPNRAKTSKEATLIIPLTPKVRERLQRNVENARWSEAELVMELIRVTLHQGYPGIQFDNQLLARPGTYRTYERNPLEATLKIISGEGIFSVDVAPQNREYQQWLSHFSGQRASDPEHSAKQICLFTLQTFLESVEDFKPQGWIKNISPDAYSIVPVV